MDIFTHNTDVTVTVDLIDTDGTVIVATAASYAVHDEEGTELATGAIVIAGDETELSATVPAAHNLVSAGETRGARTVIFTATADNGTHLIKTTYIIEKVGFLAIPAQSGQTLAGADVMGLMMPALREWSQASEREREAALVEAWSRLSRMRYRPWRAFDEITQAESTHTNLLGGTFRLNELTNEQWLVFPAGFRTALKRAQLVEADVVLEGDPAWDRRVEGLMSKTVGESSEMFRPGKPVITAVSTRAMRELSGYLDFAMRVDRG